MKKVKEVIVVECRYDKNTISQVVDAAVVTLGGFAVFKIGRASCRERV